MSNVSQSSDAATIRINLSHHTDKFIEGTCNLIISKKVNFIFGKNGTGKTTVANEIHTQLSDSYDVRVFKDFDGVVENERLNAVALGTTNVAIQKQIDIVDNEIKEIKRQTEQPENRKVENLYTNAVKTKEALDSQENKISAFFTNAAGQIKRQSNPQIAKTTYNRNNFEEDISKANLLSDNDIMVYRNTIKADEMADVGKIAFPNIDLPNYLESINNILQSSVNQPQDIPELQGNPEKQNFARQGMKIHKQKVGEVCSFCGNKISDERWKILVNYFNDEVKKLEKCIDDEIVKIESELDVIKNFALIKESNFYDQFRQDIETLNLQIKTKKNEHKEFLTNLRSALEEKRRNIFLKSELLKITIPSNFDDTGKTYNVLIESHNEWSRNLKVEQEKAKGALRYHEIQKLLDEFKYDDKNIECTKLKAANDEAQKALNAKRNILQTKQEERNNLISQTKDEEKIALKINDLLKNMGVISFSLKLVDNDVENQKGQYRIKGHDDTIRPITNLSKGEKNIIAFLYFMFSLESVDDDIRLKSKIIVLDDPMTSNDDTMQYLMIGEIQKLYRGLKDGDFLIVLTHNCHFYLNVRPDTSKVDYDKEGNKTTFYDRYGVYHFFSDGKRTTIKSITNGKYDFKTSYETLWKELIFLYETPDASPDLMLSPCRKICETYKNFTKIDVMLFYGNNINAKKLFDVNQHSIDDFEADANGRTKDEIKRILYSLFEQNNAEKHIKSYWKEVNQ